MAEPISDDELLKILRQLHNQARQADSDIDDSAAPSIAPTDGWIEVSNGQIIVHDPLEGGNPPLLSSSRRLKLYKNRQLVTGSVPVQSTDYIEWQAEQSSLFHIDVTPDHMQAFLMLHAKELFAWRLRDCAPQFAIEIDIEEDTDHVVETVHLSDIMREIQSQGITQNLQPSAIFQELRHPSYRPVLVAYGTPSLEGEDGWLELFFNAAIDNQFAKAMSHQTSKGIFDLPLVHPGDLIARKHPAIEGSVGINVYGAPLPPPPVYDEVVIARDAVRQESQGEMVALSFGRPKLSGQTIQYLDIVPVYKHTEEVHVSRDNSPLAYHGDIWVSGDVSDGAVIESHGNVYIMGDVNRARISAAGSIYISGNVVASRLYAGRYGITFNTLYMQLKKLREQFSQLLEGSQLLYRVVQARAKHTTISQIITLMIENQYPTLPHTIQSVTQYLQNIQMIDPAYGQVIHRLLSKWIPSDEAHLSYSIHLLESSLEAIVTACKNMEERQEHRVGITINHCHLTHIQSSGDICIRGQGVTHSQLHAKRNIIFYTKNGQCLSSKLDATCSISAMHVDTLDDTPSILRAGEKITVHRMNRGQIQIASHQQVIYQPLNNGLIYAGKNNLVIKTDLITPE